MKKSQKPALALPVSQAALTKRPVGTHMSQLLSVDMLSKVSGGGYAGPSANPHPPGSRKR